MYAYLSVICQIYWYTFSYSFLKITTQKCNFNFNFQFISSFAKIIFLCNHTFLYSHHVISHFLKLHIRKPLIFRLSYHTRYLKMYNLDKNFKNLTVNKWK